MRQVTVPVLSVPSRRRFAVLLAVALAACFALAAPAPASALSARESVRIEVTYETVLGYEVMHRPVEVDVNGAHVASAFTDRRGRASLRLPVAAGDHLTVRVQNFRLEWVTLVDEAVGPGERVAAAYVDPDELAGFFRESGCNAPPEGECDPDGYPGVFNFDGIDGTDEGPAGFRNDQLFRPSSLLRGDDLFVIDFGSDRSNLVMVEPPFMSSEISMRDESGDGLQDIVMTQQGSAGERVRQWIYSPATGQEWNQRVVLEYSNW